MNVFHYAAITERNWEANLSEMSGYERKYTFYADFGIAEFCEVYKADRGAVVDTFNRVIESWGKSIEAITEVAMVLNHKCWSFHDNVDSAYLHCSEEWRNYFQKVYTELYQKCVDYIVETYKDNEEALSYYYEVTD